MFTLNLRQPSIYTVKKIFNLVVMGLYFLPFSFGCTDALAETPSINEDSQSAREKRIEEKKLKLETSDWVKLALNLSGDADEVTSAAIEKLRKTPNIESILKNAIHGPYRGLALDAIAALSLSSLAPELLKQAENDEDGFIYQTLNTLLSAENSQLIVATYQKRLEDLKSPKRPSGPACVAMIDTLTRLKIPLPPTLLEAYFKHEFHEARLMALRNLKVGIEGSTQKEPSKNLYLPYLKKAFQGKPYQLRLSALFLWSQLETPLKDFMSTSLNYCMRDPNMDLRSECQFAIDRYNQSKAEGKL